MEHLPDTKYGSQKYKYCGKNCGKNNNLFMVLYE